MANSYMSIDQLCIGKNSFNDNTCYKFNLPSTLTGLIFNLFLPSPILPKKKEELEKNFLKGNMVKDLYGEQK